MNKLKNSKVYVPLLIIIGICAVIFISAIANKDGMIGYGHSYGEHGHEH